MFYAGPQNSLQIISFLGGLYIVVRGFDNIEKGIKFYAKADNPKREIYQTRHKKWKSIFGRQT